MNKTRAKNKKIRLIYIYVTNNEKKVDIFRRRIDDDNFMHLCMKNHLNKLTYSSED